MNTEHAYLTVTEVADHYRVSVQTVLRWIKAGRIKAENIASGKRPVYRIPAATLNVRPTPPPLKIRKFV